MMARIGIKVSEVLNMHIQYCLWPFGHQRGFLSVNVIYIYAHVYICIYMHVYACTYIQVWNDMYIYMYEENYKHIHTFSPS